MWTSPLIGCGNLPLSIAGWPMFSKSNFFFYFIPSPFNLRSDRPLPIHVCDAGNNSRLFLILIDLSFLGCNRSATPIRRGLLGRGFSDLAWQCCSRIRAHAHTRFNSFVRKSYISCRIGMGRWYPTCPTVGSAVHLKCD